MSALGYEFFMQECDKEGNVLAGSSPKNLEVDFSGLRYKECKGLNTIGAANVFTESYADSNRLRVHVPSNLTNKATTITLSLYFVGEDRYKTYDAFNEYLRKSPYHIYYDSARKKKFAFFVKDEIAPSNSQWYGSTPYIEVSYKLSNIFGKTEDIEI